MFKPINEITAKSRSFTNSANIKFKCHHPHHYHHVDQPGRYLHVEWICERYPLIIEKLPGAGINRPIDNLYLDFNGILHMCTHNNDFEIVNFFTDFLRRKRTSLEYPEFNHKSKNSDKTPITSSNDNQIAAFFDEDKDSSFFGLDPRTAAFRICEYVDCLFQKVKPRKRFLIAIDGVAPRAKMNQQRSRRFRSALKKQEDRLTIIKTYEIVVKELMNRGFSEETINKHFFENTLQDEQCGKFIKNLINQTDISDNTVFDSNIITPGTEFMVKMDDWLHFFITKKLHEDANWQRCENIIYSGSNVPGEGEHKIMEFIRNCKARKRISGSAISKSFFSASENEKDVKILPEFSDNETHVAYGMDADLIFLTLASHEPYFMILRENMFEDYYFESAKKLKNKPWLRNMVLLNINILRDYLRLEFKDLETIIDDFNKNAEIQKKDKFSYDFERILDDFIFMCFFVGTDFIPVCPNWYIKEKAIDNLLFIYKGIAKNFIFNLEDPGFAPHELDSYSTDFYITSENGEVNWVNMCKILEKMPEKEKEMLEERAFEAKKSRFSYKKNSKNPRNNMKERQSGTSVSKESPIEFDSPFQLLSPRETSDDMLSPDMAENGTNGEENAAETNEEYVIEEKENKPTKEPSYSDGRRQHYLDRFGFDPMTLKTKISEGGRVEEADAPDVIGSDGNKYNILENICIQYLQGVNWMYYYYTQGCRSWNWYYGQYFAPLSEDLHNTLKKIIGTHAKELSLKDIIGNFELSKPFEPLEQLMSVLPAGSFSFLPKVISNALLADKRTKEYYPAAFEIFREERDIKDHEGVAILPFIDENVIHAFMNEQRELLDEVAKAHNCFGNSILFKYQFNKSKEVVISPVVVPETVKKDFGGYFDFTASKKSIIHDSTDSNGSVKQYNFCHVRNMVLETEKERENYVEDMLFTMDNMYSNVHLKSKIFGYKIEPKCHYSYDIKRLDGWGSLFFKNPRLMGHFMGTGCTVIQQKARNPSLHITLKTEEDEKVQPKPRGDKKNGSKNSFENEEIIDENEEEEEETGDYGPGYKFTKSLGTHAYVGYPYPQKMFISSIADSKYCYYPDSEPQKVQDVAATSGFSNSPDLAKDFEEEVTKLSDVLMYRYGIDCPSIKALLYAKPMLGISADGAEVYADYELTFPIHFLLSPNEYDLKFSQLKPLDKNKSLPLPCPCFLYPNILLAKQAMPAKDKKKVIDSNFVGLVKEITPKKVKEDVIGFYKSSFYPKDFRALGAQLSPLSEFFKVPNILGEILTTEQKDKGVINWYQVKDAAAILDVPVTMINFLLGSWKFADDVKKPKPNARDRRTGPNEMQFDVGLRFRDQNAYKYAVGYVRTLPLRESTDVSYFMNVETQLREDLPFRKQKRSIFSTFDNTKPWEVSRKCLAVLEEYRSKFPELWENLKNMFNGKNKARPEISQMFAPPRAWSQIEIDDELSRGLTDDERALGGMQTSQQVKNLDEIIPKMDAFAKWSFSLPHRSAPFLDIEDIRVPIEAIQEIEKLFIAQTSQIKSSDSPKEAGINFDIAPLHAFTNLKAPYHDKQFPIPPLGSKVINMFSAAVPIGSLGVVIGILRDVATVLFFDEILGANNLNSMLKTYRAQTVPWKYLCHITDVEEELKEFVKQAEIEQQKSQPAVKQIVPAPVVKPVAAVAKPVAAALAAPSSPRKTNPVVVAAAPPSSPKKPAPKEENEVVIPPIRSIIPKPVPKVEEEAQDEVIVPPARNPAPKEENQTVRPVAPKPQPTLAPPAKVDLKVVKKEKEKPVINPNFELDALSLSIVNPVVQDWGKLAHNMDFSTMEVQNEKEIIELLENPQNKLRVYPDEDGGEAVVSSNAALGQFGSKYARKFKGRDFDTIPDLEYFGESEYLLKDVILSADEGQKFVRPKRQQ